MGRNGPHYSRSGTIYQSRRESQLGRIHQIPDNRWSWSGCEFRWSTIGTVGDCRSRKYGDRHLNHRLHEKSFNGSVGSHWRSGLSKSDSKEGPSLIDVLGEELAGQIADAGATSNVELIETIPSAQKAVVQHAFYQSLGTMWIMVSESLVSIIVSLILLFP